MKKALTSLLLSLVVGLSLVACSDSTTTETVAPEDLKPALGLVAIAGDGAVTLMFDAANSAEDKVEATAFSVYMAEGEVALDTASGSKEDLADAADFNANPDIDLAADPASLYPMALIKVADLGVTLPGKVAITLSGEICVPVLEGAADAANAEVEADDDDDTADDDDDAAADDDDAAAEEKLAASQDATDATDTTDDDDDAADDDDEVTYEGTDCISKITLENGKAYTFFVTVRGKDDFSAESWTSNRAMAVPRPEIEAIELVKVTSTTGTTDGFDIENLELVEVLTLDSAYADANATADLVLEYFAFSAYGYTDASPFFSGANGARVQDMGYVGEAAGAWDSVLYASDATDSYIPSGQSVAATLGHVYAIQTEAGSYGKLVVTAIDTVNQTVSFNAAFQTSAEYPTYLKK